MLPPHLLVIHLDAAALKPLLAEHLKAFKKNFSGTASAKEAG